MPDKLLSRERYGEAFWRAHHEAWRHSELNQRECCESQGIPLKAFGNWRAKFKAEPQPPSPKLLYRRRGLSHTLSHSLSHRLSHDLPIGPIIPPAHEGQAVAAGTRRCDRPVSSPFTFGPRSTKAVARLFRKLFRSCSRSTMESTCWPFAPPSMRRR